MLGDFFKYLASEASVILEAPVTFGMGILASAAIVWWLANLRYGGVIDSQRERLHARDEKIADYKAKLEGAEPEEARAHIKELEARLARLEPRRLSDSQRQAMAQHLRTVQGTITISLDGACSEGRPLATGLAGVFHEAGWHVESPMVLGPGNPPQTGLGVRVRDLNNLSHVDRVLFAAMDASGLSYERSGGLRVGLRGQHNAEILVTSSA